MGAKSTVTAMRRAWLIVGLLAAVLIPVPPAAAHICAIPAHFTRNEDVVLNIAVAAEDKPIRAVDIALPAGFALKDAAGFLGFTATRHGQDVHFEGGEIGIYDCQSFSLSGRPTRTGKLVAHIVTTADDGTKTYYDDLRSGSQFPAQVIYVTAGKARTHSTSRSLKPELQLGVVLAAGLALFAIARSRKHRS
jgi:hypothetical protein